MKFAAFMLLVLTAMLWWVGDVEAKPTFVVQDEQAITCDSWGWRDNALDVGQALGMRVVRVNMYEWRPGCLGEDAAIGAIAAAGMKPQLTLAGSLPYMHSKVLEHRALVSTYTIWNEPELAVFRCCSEPFSPRGGLGSSNAYRTAFPRAFRQVKRDDPGARVCWGEHSPFGLGGYLKRALRKKARAVRADCLAIHPYFWFWSKKVDRKYFKALLGFKRLVAKLARKRRFCRPGPGCRPVPIYNTEAGIPLWDGQDGDAAAVKRAYRICAKLRFRQCAQYQVFPGFDENHSPQQWNTALTDLNCQPTATFYALRRRLTGARGLAPVVWPECPKPIPATVPLPPSWGTPAQPPLPPAAPPVPDAPEVEVLPDQPPEAIPPPSPLPDIIVEEPVLELPGPPEPTPEPEPVPVPDPPVEPPPVEPPPVEPPPVEVPPTEGETP